MKEPRPTLASFVAEHTDKKYSINEVVFWSGKSRRMLYYWLDGSPHLLKAILNEMLSEDVANAK